MTAILSHRRERAGGAAAAATLTLALGALLVAGLAVRAQVASDQEGIALFRVAPDPPPPPEAIRTPQRDTRPEGEAAPPNLTSRATPVEVPEPVVPLPLPPPPMPVTKKAADSTQATSGAADTPGPGSGAGGQGDGFGAGGSGDGRGAGDPDATPPRWIRGDIRDSEGHAFWVKIFASSWSRNSHTWGSRDKVYLVAMLLAIALTVLAATFARRYRGSR